MMINQTLADKLCDDVFAEIFDPAAKLAKRPALRYRGKVSAQALDDPRANTATGALSKNAARRAETPAHTPRPEPQTVSAQGDQRDEPDALSDEELVDLGKKYKLDKRDTIEVEGRTLFRIIALRPVVTTGFNGVPGCRFASPGDRGGHIEFETNLDHGGASWVAPGACVFGAAAVLGDAIVRDRATVSGGAMVDDSAIVEGESSVRDAGCISGQAKLHGAAVVDGRAIVTGSAVVYGRVSDRAFVSGDMHIDCRGVVAGDANLRGDYSVFGRATLTPLVLTGFPHRVVISDDQIKIGCEILDFAAFRARGREIISADGWAARADEWYHIICELILQRENQLRRGGSFRAVAAAASASAAGAIV